MAATESELREWAGQCLAVGLPGPSVDRASARMLAELRAGTVILFARNTPDVLTTRQLADDLQALAAKAHRGPLLVCADQEGGRVQRLREGATDLPAAMLLGQAGPDHVRAVSAMAADELLAAGITFVLAPVCDVNVEPENPIIGNRAFGADSELVGACVAAAVEGYQSAGLLTCAKHFPGHGDTRVDSHLGLPVLERTPAQLEEVELPPFRSAVAAGVDSVMVGHLAVPALDPSGTPASLSEPWLGGLLRERLGWQGVVCADDLEMAGVTGQDTTAGELAVRAMAAGCDLLFFSHTYGKAVEAAAALVEAVGSGRLREARLHEAAERVRALRAHPRAAAPPALADVGSAPHAAIVDAAAAAGVRWVRQAAATGAAGYPRVVSLDDARLTPAESSAGVDRFLGCALLRGLHPESPEHLEEHREPLLVGVRRPDRETVQRLDRLSRQRSVTVVALAEPWVLEQMPAASAIAACDGGRAACDRALDLVLQG